MIIKDLELQKTSLAKDQETLKTLQRLVAIVIDTSNLVKAIAAEKKQIQADEELIKTLKSGYAAALKNAIFSQNLRYVRDVRCRTDAAAPGCITPDELEGHAQFIVTTGFP